MKNKNAKKIIIGIVVVLFLAVIVFLVWKTKDSMKLADSFNENEVTAKAQEAVDYLIAGEYESDRAMMTEELQGLITAEVLKTNMDSLSKETGAFKEYKSTAVIGQKNSSTGEDMAVAVIVATFEKRAVTYTITFTEDMLITGFYMK